MGWYGFGAAQHHHAHGGAVSWLDCGSEGLRVSLSQMAVSGSVFVWHAGTKQAG